MTTDLKDATRRLYAALASGDEDAIRSLMDPDVVDHSPEPDQEPGIDGVLEAFRTMHAAFDDFSFEPERMLVEGDLVAAHARIQATHTGEYMGVAATGQRIDVQVMDMLRWEDGVLRERWGVFDAASMMHQLGMIPG